MKNIKLIEVPSEIGAGTRGASLGIDAIKIAALDFMSNFFIHFPCEKIPVENLTYETGVAKVSGGSKYFAREISFEKEKEIIAKALKKHRGRRRDAANELGISERTLYRKIKEYDIEE